MQASENPSVAPSLRAQPRSLFHGSHLLVTVALGLVLCQLPLLIWLLPPSGLQLELSLRLPWLAQVLEPMQSTPWLPIVLATLLSVVCLRWARVHIVLPLMQIRRQMEALQDNHYSVETAVNGCNVEIDAVARACQSLRVQLAHRATEHLKLAYEDGMTGLHNRLRFVMAVDQVLKSTLKRVLVVVWQLDRFNSLNTILGFAAGDHLLKSLGMRLKMQLDDTLSVARLSSHTFACAFELDEEDCIEGTINRVLDTLVEPLRVYGQPIELSAACGAAMSPRDGQAAGDLTRRAEIAQNIASSSRLRWMMFQNHFEVQSSARLNMLSELRAALQTRGQLQLHLQPKLDLRTGRIEEAEALLRWQHPQRGMVFPNEFIPFAEQTGRIHELTLWAIGEACSMLREFLQDSALKISVNISAMDLHEPGFVDAVAALLKRQDIPPRQLCLEITESWAMDRPDQVLDTLERLHRMGLWLAIDDFGSGYSSMSYMKKFPVDELKIDRSLVAGVKRNSDSETILRCIIELGHSMGLRVTAEGVETLEEFSAVRALSIDSIQGYLIGKAMPVSQFRQFMHGFDSHDLLGLPGDSKAASNAAAGGGAKTGSNSGPITAVETGSDTGSLSESNRPMNPAHLRRQ